MKINLNALSRYKDKVISEDIIFPKEMLEDIKKIKKKLDEYNIEV